MTEEEAKTKVCPQTFGWENTEARDILHSDNCIGSDCMMWQWREALSAESVKTDGYCGLAERVG